MCSSDLEMGKPSGARSALKFRMIAIPSCAFESFLPRVLCVEGMWFQDLFNYDFRRTEMCVIPYGTQEGEISFCAYNTGVGWRQIIENMHKTANLAEWYEEHGRHAVYAAGHNVPGIAKKHSLSLPIIQAVLAEDADEKPVVVSPYLVEEREEQSVTV